MQEADDLFFGNMLLHSQSLSVEGLDSESLLYSESEGHRGWYQRFLRTVLALLHTAASGQLNREFFYPHFEYPQFKHVWHPSISTSAWVLHLAQSVAPGGKPVDSVAGWLSAAVAAALGVGLAAAS